ncbi:MULTISPECIES: helicase-related protein [unclassified Meiothermus]|uniref:helicase-related protein n=1 Tax=unclassified Meiothermus TaxID=370471 RepID=UPI000D7C29CF|nr:MULTISPECIES: helicase-related protein [unclassified Meiothermus]PZA06055.1 DNA/RNA helicase, superfamily II, SNF2 family protein [Meiothermus sp. Pnk-1]RYM36150.1 DNA/RNA helicase, superfamily II, SNF2 family protein [Meiothermus sp. PNK-Is4]
MNLEDLLRPGALFRARGRDFRLEHRQGDVLFARAVDTEEEALFYLPLEGPGLRLTTLGLPPATPGDPALHDLLLRALDLSTLHADAPFLALQRSRVVPANYQLVPLLMALRQPEVRLLIADDVGLGKTVEAGLIVKELLLRNKARRVLVLAPAHLLPQWQEALRRFFHLEFAILSGPNLKRLARTLPPGANPWAHFDRVIASVDYAKQDGVRHLVLHQDWDLLLVDEAHMAARPPTERGKQMERYRLVRELSRRVPHLLLLTATPHSGHSESFQSLLEHLDAGRLGLFKGGVLDREAAKKHVVQRRRRDVEDWFRREGKPSPFPEREAREVPVEPNRAELELFEAVRRYQAEVYDPDPAKVPVLGRWLSMHLMRRATSSPRALEQSLKRRKALLENALSAQEATDEEAAALFDGVPDKLLPEEAEVGLELTLADQARLEAEKAYLEVLLRHLRSWRKDSKLEALLEMLKDPLRLGRGRTLVFTRYKDTLDYLVEKLQEALPYPVFAVHGEMREEEREAVLEAFVREKPAVLVATDVFSEGLNLQHHASQLVHYDLPWNPNRLEQRNGRIDRFGQPEPVVRIRTLYYERSFDVAVFRLLLEKAERIRRELGVVPAFFGEETYLRARLEALWQRDWRGERRLQAPLFAEEEAPEWEAAYRAVREGFYGHSEFSLPDVENRLQEALKRAGSPKTLESFVLDGLRYLGWQVEGQDPYTAQRGAGEPVPGLPPEFGPFSFDPQAPLGVEVLDLAHPLVEHLVGHLRFRAYRDLDGARTALLALPPGAGEPVALYHFRARFLGPKGEVLESLFRKGVRLLDLKELPPEKTEALWQNRRKQAPALSRQQARILAEEALRAPLEELGPKGALEVLARLRAEREALKRDLARAYGTLPEAFQDLDRLELLGHELLAITLLA